MFRPAAARSLLRHASSSSSSSATARTALLLRKPATTPSHRLLSTSAAPSKKRSTLKGTAARWALAAGIVYWYTTSAVFADEPKFEEERPAGPTEAETDRPASLLPTTPLRRSKTPPSSTSATSATSSTTTTTATTATGKGESAALATHTRAPDELEEEASQEGAFNPETGEINWDCPCLGGMAHGPCGEEFKAAFSCFIFSTEEPKGVDCIDKFKGMQACFQQHPDIYGSELDGDDDDDDDDLDADTDPDTDPSTTPLAAKSSETSTGRLDRSSSLSASSSPGSTTPLAAKSSETSTGRLDRSSSLSASSSPGSTATTGSVPAHTGTAPAATGSTPATRSAAPPAEVTERTTAPSLAEPSSSVAETPVLQGAHRGDAKARSISDPPTEREKAVAEEDAPRRK